MSFRLSTRRLILREFQKKDAAELYALNSDPQVLRHTGDPPFDSLADAERFLEKYNDYQKWGYGRWAVIDKENQAWLGWCGLKHDLVLDETDIGFRFFRKFWNNGYATEAARICLDFGFSSLGLPCIVGRASRENKASVRVLQKLGLTYWKSIETTDLTWQCYRIFPGE